MASIIASGDHSCRVRYYEYQPSLNNPRKRTVPLEGWDSLLRVNGPSKKRAKTTHEEDRYHNFVFSSVDRYLRHCKVNDHVEAEVKDAHRLNEFRNTEEHLLEKIAELEWRIIEMYTEILRERTTQEFAVSNYNIQVRDLQSLSEKLQHKDAELLSSVQDLSAIREHYKAYRAHVNEEHEKVVSEIEAKASQSNLVLRETAEKKHREIVSQIEAKVWEAEHQSQRWETQAQTELTNCQEAERRCLEKDTLIQNLQAQLAVEQKARDDARKQCNQKDAAISQARNECDQLRVDWKEGDDNYTGLLDEFMKTADRQMDLMNAARRKHEYAERRSAQTIEALKNSSDVHNPDTTAEVLGTTGAHAIQLHNIQQSRIGRRPTNLPATRAMSMRPTATGRSRPKLPTERDVLGSRNSQGNSGISKTNGRSGQSSISRGLKSKSAPSSARSIEEPEEQVDERSAKNVFRDIKDRMSDMILANAVTLYKEGQFDQIHANGLAGVCIVNTDDTIMHQFSQHKGKRMVAAEIRVEDIDPKERKRIFPCMEQLDTSDLNIDDYLRMCYLAHFPEVHVKAAKSVLMDGLYLRFRARFVEEYDFDLDEDGERKDCFEKMSDSIAWNRTVGELARLPQFKNACKAWGERSSQDGAYCWPPTFTDPEVIRVTSFQPEKDYADAMMARDVNKPLTTRDFDDLDACMLKADIKRGTFEDMNI